MGRRVAVVVAGWLVVGAGCALGQAGVEAGGLGAASATAASGAGKATGGAIGGAMGKIGGGLGAATGGAGAAGGGGGAAAASAPESAPLSMGSRRARVENWVTVKGANPGGPAKVWAPLAGDALGKGFELATVKLAERKDAQSGQGSIYGPAHGSEVDLSGRFTVSGMPLSGLVWLAYVGGQQAAQVEGGPAWSDTDLWDIEAQMDDADMAGWLTLSDAQRMERVRPQLRELLAERFGLRVHTEMKMTDVYALVQAKGGVKMKMVAAPAVMETSGLTVEDGAWEGHAVQVNALAGQVGFAVGAKGKLLVDETGLGGFYYDFALRLRGDKPAAEQIEQGLGLRVEERTVPVKTYVVDEATRAE